MKTLMSALALSVALVACGGGAPSTTRTPAPTPNPEPTVSHELVLEVTWDNMDRAGQAELCESYELLGPEASYMTFIDGYEGKMDYRTFTGFFDDVCN